jgi:hypothetical protein
VLPVALHHQVHCTAVMKVCGRHGLLHNYNHPVRRTHKRELKEKLQIVD